MKRKLAEHWVLLLSDLWQIRHMYIMAFDDTFGRGETPRMGAHDFLEIGERSWEPGEGVRPAAEDPKPEATSVWRSN